ncbi:hypothetical protein ACI8AA_07010 [Geodermatophilus sp. SYSU D01180]
MAIVWFTDRDRQDMADAREERRVLDELTERYAVYREVEGPPGTETLLWLFERGLPPDRSPRRGAEGEEG